MRACVRACVRVEGTRTEVEGTRTEEGDDRGTRTEEGDDDRARRDNDRTRRDSTTAQRHKRPKRGSVTAMAKQTSQHAHGALTLAAGLYV